jgi:hypothetical protein
MKRLNSTNLDISEEYFVALFAALARSLVAAFLLCPMNKQCTAIVQLLGTAKCKQATCNFNQ